MYAGESHLFLWNRYEAAAIRLLRAADSSRSLKLEWQVFTEPGELPRKAGESGLALALRQAAGEIENEFAIFGREST
jgi:hypothetical protein